MVLIPFDKKFDWKKPPVITLLLIVINVLIYFTFQFNDDTKIDDARQFYYRSGLDNIEIPRFKEALKEQGEHEFLNYWDSYSQREQSPWFFYLQSNKPFIDALENDEIITPDNPDYEQWKSNRAHLAKLMARSVTWSYSLKAGDPNFVTIISHMFLHGSFSHLLGNMIFLLAVGFIVELAMNRYLYLAIYLMAGIGSALFYIPSASETLIPSLGASGAISGLMGMYAVLFNTRKVRFFYFIGVYFDYVKLPAIYLLVLWLGYQLILQLNYAHISNVNYLAHIGGLISGALLIFALTKLKSSGINHNYLDENHIAEQFTHSLNQADNYIQDLHYEKAVPLLAQLLDQQPDNREVLFKYYKTSKLDIGSDAHHHAAMKILALSENDGATDQLVIDTFNDYRKVPKARLTVSLLNNIMKRCINFKAVDDAEKIVMLMQKQPHKFTSLPQHLRALINECMRAGQSENAKKHTLYLLTHYPDNQETQIAKSLIS